MKIINVDVNDEIIFKSILDADTGILKGVSSTLKLPTGNYNNILLNFNFLNTCLCEKLNLVCSFCINGKETIDVKIGKVTVEGYAEYKTACYIPAEVFADPCYFEFGIYGIAFDDTENIKQRISLFPVKNMVYKGSYDPNSKESEIPTPTLFEQYFAEVDVANEKLMQLEEIVAEKVMLYKKCENSYIASAGETIIPIDVENFSDMFCLIVNKNGQALIKDVDYTINYEGRTITLLDAIKSNETVIHFVAFSSVVGSTEEITQMIKAEIGENSITADKIEWENILNKPSMYKPPVASDEVLGGIKVGEGLEIETDGTLNLNGDYEKLNNLPQINGVKLKGNKTSKDIHVADYEHTHTQNEITDLTLPTKVSAFENDIRYASESYVKNAIASVQLEGSDADIDLSGYATQDELFNKVDKMQGYSLVADTEISRLALVENYDDTEIRNALDNKATTSDVETALNEAKEYADSVVGGGSGEGITITLDDVVSSESSNGVKSSGIYNAIQNATNTAIQYSVNTANENINTALNQKIQCSTTDLEAGVSELDTGVIYLVYE